MTSDYKAAIQRGTEAFARVVSQQLVQRVCAINEVRKICVEVDA